MAFLVLGSGSQQRRSLFITEILMKQLIPWCHYPICIAISPTVEAGCTSASPRAVNSAAQHFLELVRSSCSTLAG